jgi:hypothetical protein
LLYEFQKANLSQVQFTLFYGYFSSWRQIINVKFEICGFIETAKGTQGIDQIVTNFLERTKGSNLMKCPLENGTIFKITNYTESSKGYMNLPGGNYLVGIKLSNDFDDQIFDFKLKYSIKNNATEKYEF